MGKQDAARSATSQLRRQIYFAWVHDTHVHFFQSADLSRDRTVPILTVCVRYKTKSAWIKSHVDGRVRRYIRSGITSVVDVGGPMWNFEVRRKQRNGESAARSLGGPALSSVSRENSNLGDPPIVRSTRTAIRLATAQRIG